MLEYYANQQEFTKKPHTNYIELFQDKLANLRQICLQDSWTFLSTDYSHRWEVIIIQDPLPVQKILRAHSHHFVCSVKKKNLLCCVMLYSNCTHFRFKFYLYLGKFSRRPIDNIVFFPENWLWHFMQIVILGDNSHEMPTLIFRQNKEHISKTVFWKFYTAR